jgi:hypothetical protein
MLHRQALAYRNMNEELQTVYQAVRVVNCVKNRPLRGRLFIVLFDDLEAENTVLLCCCEAHQLSCSKGLHSIFELKEEIAIFLSDSNNNDDADSCYNEHFIQKLVYLVDFFFIN